MRTIALEEHFLASGFADATRRRGDVPGRSTATGPAAEVAVRREAQLADSDSLRLADMDTAGIDVQVLSHTIGSRPPFTGSEGMQLARQANDQMAAAVAAHPDRFVGLATLPMTEPEAAAAELERAVVSLGCKGAVINGTTNGRFLDDAMFLPILEEAVRLDVPVYLHPAPPPVPVWEAYYGGLEPGVRYSLATGSWGWHSEVGLHALRLIVAGIFDRLPSLQVIIGHMGEMIPFMLARITRGAHPGGHVTAASDPGLLCPQFLPDYQRLLQRSTAALDQGSLWPRPYHVCRRLPLQHQPARTALPGQHSPYRRGEGQALLPECRAALQAGHAGVDA